VDGNLLAKRWRVSGLASSRVLVTGRDQRAWDQSFGAARVIISARGYPYAAFQAGEVDLGAPRLLAFHRKLPVSWIWYDFVW
jgi:hypothetical protein